MMNEFGEDHIAASEVKKRCAIRGGIENVPRKTARARIEQHFKEKPADFRLQRKTLEQRIVEPPHRVMVRKNGAAGSFITGTVAVFMDVLSGSGG
jgi:hypothetical protein